MVAPVLVGTPIVTSRQWTTGLAPRAGGWMFIAQSYNNGVNVPSEWVLVKLEAGTYTITTGPNYVYANSNYQIDSANTLVTTNNQIRAPGGRIFFLLASDAVAAGIGTNLKTAYYDPADENVHQLADINDTTGNRHAITYSSVFNTTGSVLYIGTQAAIGFKPIVCSINPSTLATAVIGQVGSAASANPKYAYYLARDVGNNWLYVAVGQDPWEVIKIDVTTGVQTVLYTTGGVGTCAVNFDVMPNGWRCTIVDNGITTLYWMADGALSAYPGTGAPPGGARTVTPYSNPLVNPPTVDWSQGIGRVLWRANGSTGAFTTINYAVTYTSGINLETLTALHDGTVLGNGEQYNGFFRDTNNVLTWYGAWPLGVSEPAVLSVSNSLVYIAGYPNGVLYRYNPSAAWSVGTNPVQLGSYFAASGVKYSYYLRLGTNGRLYQCGRRERDSTGSGLGYYVPTSGTFSGQTAAPLDNYIPRGFVVMDSINRVVFSGETLDGSDARILVYDLNLAAVTSYLVQAGIKNTGALFKTSDPNTLVALTNDAPYYLYKINVLTGAISGLTTMGGAVGAYAVREDDRSVWVMVGTTLTRIDVDTLEVFNVQTITGVTQLAWSLDSRILYLAKTADVYRRASITTIDPEILKPTAADGFTDSPPQFYAVAIDTLNAIAAQMGTVAAIDPSILSPSSKTGKASSVPAFFDVVIAKINEMLETVPATAQIDPDLLDPDAENGFTTAIPAFYDVIIDAINSIASWL